MDDQAAIKPKQLRVKKKYLKYEYAEIGSQAKLRIWCSKECKSSSLFTRKRQGCTRVDTHGK